MLFLLILLLSTPAFAGEKPVLSVKVSNSNSQQWTKIFHGKSGWYCSTDVNPLFPLLAKPKSLNLVKKGSFVEHGCKETLSATNEKGKVWKTCATDAEGKEFLRALGSECGRF